MEMQLLIEIISSLAFLQSIVTNGKQSEKKNSIRDLCFLSMKVARNGEENDLHIRHFIDHSVYIIITKYRSDHLIIMLQLNRYKILFANDLLMVQIHSLIHAQGYSRLKHLIKTSYLQKTYVYFGQALKWKIEINLQKQRIKITYQNINDFQRKEI